LHGKKVQQVLKDVQKKALNPGYSKPWFIWGEAAAMIEDDPETALGIGQLIMLYFFNIFIISGLMGKHRTFSRYIHDAPKHTFLLWPEFYTKRTSELLSINNNHHLVHIWLWCAPAHPPFGFYTISKMGWPV
jgi:hypothetical protein